MTGTEAHTKHNTHCTYMYSGQTPNDMAVDQEVCDLINQYACSHSSRASRRASQLSDVHCVRLVRSVFVI